MNEAPVLYLVIPCYNEEEVLPLTLPAVTGKLDRLKAAGLCHEDSRVLFVDDGSKDGTWALLEQAFTERSDVCAVKLAHNRGHQNALYAGLMTALPYADCTVSMDADLQDDVEVLNEFLQKFAEGCDVVYGVRRARRKDTFFKRATARGFYRFMRGMGADVVYDHADYRLMSKRALQALAEYGESNLFLRGIVPDIGYKSDVVYYERSERAAGRSKYPLRKMIAFAVDGITSFSVKPLTVISRAGIVISLLSVLGLLYALISKFFLQDAVAGWTAIVASIWLLGGIQLFCLGILGTYIGKIFSEVKHRPRYVTERFLKK